MGSWAFCVFLSAHTPHQLTNFTYNSEGNESLNSPWKKKSEIYEPWCKCNTAKQITVPPSRPGRPRNRWRCSVEGEMREAGLNWWQSKRQSQDRRVWRSFLKDLCPSWVKENKSVVHDVNWYWQIKKFLKVGSEVNQEKPSCAQWCLVDPFNKSNLYSFPLLRSLKLYVFNRISKAEYVVNSRKLYN